MRLFPPVTGIDASARAQRLATRGVYVLDVRRPSEWRRGHIRGSQNLPLMQLKSGLATPPRKKTIVTICASGHRRAAAARMLERAGFRVENLRGGMQARAKAALPVEKG